MFVLFACVTLFILCYRDVLSSFIHHIHEKQKFGENLKANTNFLDTFLKPWKSVFLCVSALNMLITRVHRSLLIFKLSCPLDKYHTKNLHENDLNSNTFFLLQMKS